MSNLGIAFYVLGALFTLYVIAATWKSRDCERPLSGRPSQRS